MKTSKLKKALVYSTSIVLLAITLFVANLFLRQDAILFKGIPLESDFKFDSKYDFEELYFDASDGGKIHALYYKAKDPKGILLFYRGQTGNLSTWTSSTYRFLSKGYNVLALDYRSSGKSKGLLNQKNLLNDAELLYHFARKHYEPKDIVLYGRSLGSGIATYVASKHPSKLLILETPYVSILEEAKKTFPYIPNALCNFIVKYPLRTDLWIKHVKAPIELFHGTEDETISYSASEKLCSLLKGKASIRLNTFIKGKHNNLHKMKDYHNRLEKLLAK